MKNINANWLANPDTQAVFAMLENAGFQVFAVGGCVRNSVFDVAVSDIDLATDALPEQVLNLAETLGFQAIPTGLAHGTITVIVNNTPYEITTFRNDIAPDGRHTTVAFSKDIVEDAQRRDFTMNALYCDKSGNISDPLNGLPDTIARRLRFIGSPDQRIREDFLRILRFFRFYAQYCDQKQDIDPQGFAACAANKTGLAQISKERITAEMQKLLAVADPCGAMGFMQQSGILTQILPGADIKYLPALVKLEQVNTRRPNWLRRLKIINPPDVGRFLCLSKRDRKYLKQMPLDMALAEAAYRFGHKMALDAALVRAATSSQPLGADFKQQITLGDRAVFPISAADLMPEISPGPALGAELRRLENRWIKSGFMLDKSDLL